MIDDSRSFDQDNFLAKVTNDLITLGDNLYIIRQRSYFNAYTGGYGEGDLFLGVKVPSLRRYYKELGCFDKESMDALFKSPYHEIRFLALLNLINLYKKAEIGQKLYWLDYYLDKVKEGSINNWDMVDLAGPAIGTYFLNNPNFYFNYKHLVKSDNVWLRRSFLLFAFVFKKDYPAVALKSCKLLISDTNLLISKPLGWLIREVGKNHPKMMCAFIDKHGFILQRAALRSAIERLDVSERRRLLELFNK